MNIWKAIKPWLLSFIIILALRYTGALAGISSVANSALLGTTLLDATPKKITVPDKLNYNFSVSSLEGNSIDFSSFKGKTLFINLWATWCGPCRAEMPGIQNLYADYAKNDSIAFVMLSLDKPNQIKKVKTYIETQQFTFPVYIAEELPTELQVSSIPTTVIISADGTIMYKNVGMANYDTQKFRSFLNKTIKK